MVEITNHFFSVQGDNNISELDKVTAAPCPGLDVEVEEIPTGESDVKKKYMGETDTSGSGEISRQSDGDTSLYDWWQKYKQGDVEGAKENLIITCFTSDREQSWKSELIEVYPTDYQVESQENQIPTEKVTIEWKRGKLRSS